MKVPKKILIIRFSSIGDIVLTSPIARCLKINAPETELHFLTKDKYREIVENNPYYNKIHYLRNSVFETISILRQEKYDLIIDLHNNQRTFLIKSFLFVKSNTFKKLNIKKWLLVKFKWNILPKIHIVERYFDTICFLGVNYDGNGLDYYTKDDENIELFDDYNNLIKNFIAIAIGGNHQTKAISKEIIIKISETATLPIVLLGGKEDFQKGEEIIRLSNHKIINKCGKISLNQSASLISKACYVISGDTGLMHIAAAYKKPIISIWGNTVTDFGMYPLFPLENNPLNFIIENKTLDCRPCSKLGFKECPKKHFKCMNELDFTEIYQAINQLEKDCVYAHNQ